MTPIEVSIPNGTLVHPQLNIWVEIVEQPKSSDMRFRYRSESRAGHLRGANINDSQATYPTIRLCGPDRASITHFSVATSLVSVDEPHRPHPHKLTGDGCQDNGVHFAHYEVNDPGDITVQFDQLTIQYVKRNEEEDSLAMRASCGIDPFGTSNAPSNTPIDKNTVRLCFQVSVRIAPALCTYFQLQPVVSTPVRDKRVSLAIHRISPSSCSSHGNREIVLLCERLRKGAISVEFREHDPKTGQLLWSERGAFTEADVHKQVAILLRAPPYRDPHIRESRMCSIRLFNRQTRECSEDLRFVYTPHELGCELQRERQMQQGRSTVGVTARNNSNDAVQLHTAAPPMSGVAFQSAVTPSDDLTSELGELTLEERELCQMALAYDRQQQMAVDDVISNMENHYANV